MEWELIRESEKLKADIQTAGLSLMQPFYEKYGMNFLKISVITEAEMNENLTLNVLAQNVNKAAANMSVIVTNLVKEGYLKKVTSTYDRRVTYIQITDKGREMLQKSRYFIIKRYESVMSDGQEIKDLIDAAGTYLNKLLEANRKIVTSESFEL